MPNLAPLYGALTPEGHRIVLTAQQTHTPTHTHTNVCMDMFLVQQLRDSYAFLYVCENTPRLYTHAHSTKYTHKHTAIA